MTAEQILTIVEETQQQNEFLEYLATDIEQSVNDAAQNWYINEFVADSDGEPIIALMEHTEEDFDICKNYINKSDYTVVDDDEADELWEESLDNYIDECILPDLPENMQQYFDRESWVSDAKHDGRGHALNLYDGSEHGQIINGTTYYIYRRN